MDKDGYMGYGVRIEMMKLKAIEIKDEWMKII
jgi:hypothetical protein